MTTPYIKYFNNTRESNLLHNLVSESVKMMGFPVLYIPKEHIDDVILYEAKSSSYTHAYPLDVQINDPTYWEGNYDSMTKFEIMNDNRATIKCSVKSFKELKIPGRTEPRPGDLLFMEFSGNYMEITFFLNQRPWFPMGTLPTYEMMCESYKYNNEHFATGNDKIDTIETQLSETNMFNLGQNAEIQGEADVIRDFNIKNPFGGL